MGKAKAAGGCSELEKGRVNEEYLEDLSHGIKGVDCFNESFKVF